MDRSASADTQAGYESSAASGSASPSAVLSTVKSTISSGGVTSCADAQYRRRVRHMIIAIDVEKTVANNVVGRIPAGSVEPAAARSAITPVGNNVTLDVLIARNKAIAFDAVPLHGFSLSSSCMARMPNGVAALPRPRAFADIFRIIAPIAGWFAGTSGNNRTISGRIVFAITVSMPPSSATFINPRKNAITPIRPIARVTELPAVSTIPLARACIGDTASAAPGFTPGLIHVTWRQPATTNAIRMMAKNIPFMAQVALTFFPATPINPAASMISTPPR